MPFASLFSIEDNGDEPTHEQNTLYAQLDRAQLMKKRREVRPRSSHYIGYIGDVDASRIMEIVPWSEGRQNVTLVIVKNKFEALVFASANQYERLFSFIAERIPDREEVLLDVLLYGASYADLTAMKSALAEGADINGKNHGLTALARATYRKDGMVVMKLLLDSGADVGFDGGLALRTAVDKWRLDEVEFLIENGADVNVNSGEALKSAIKSGTTMIGRLLIENGADVNLKHNDGWTPLYTALKRRKFQMVRLLIKYGARTDHEATPEEIERLMEDMNIPARDRDILLGRNPMKPAQTKSKR